MVRFELNGKPLDPKTFQDQFLKGVMERAAAHMQQRLSSIRHPVTGEVPTVLVSATSLSDIRATVEGSPELLAVVAERLGKVRAGDQGEGDGQLLPVSSPRVFLSYAWEDSDLAGRIARALQANGIDTFWAEWSIGLGDSLVQKVNEGLSDCTHFVALLTPVSMTKPWVQQEMDAGLVRKINAKCRFIALRHDVAASRLPPLLATLLSPEIRDVDVDIQQLVNDIHGISRRPPLGPLPAAVARQSG